ncbi:MAG: O-antigen ligase family protein [Candidatus Omnitrophica bacterium]|nr:O-antigen ligase family protein [Candidatus Omnitrophota bacterium]
MEDPGLLTFVAVTLAASVFLLTLISTNAAVLLLIFSMLLSPEISVGALTDRAVVIRFDDLLLGVVFFTWLGKLAINKELGLIRSTPLNRPLGMFILCCCLSTGAGIVGGTVRSPMGSFFYLLKYVEYFLLYFMVANVIHDRAAIERCLKAFCLVAVLVSLYAYWQLATHGTLVRVTAPFEGKGEPNTLAGYLVLTLGVCLGLTLYATSAFHRLLYLGTFLFMLPPFMYTYSRGGYAAFLTAYLVIMAFTKRHRLLLVALFVFGVLLSQTVIPGSVFQRLAETFSAGGVNPYLVEVGGHRLSASAAYRVVIWQIIWERWLQHPVLGFGVSGLGIMVDNQHALVLGELGLVGMWAYLWVRWKLFIQVRRIFTELDDPLAKGLSLGFLGAFLGLLIHSFAGNIFIIVRIMEPFWFLAAMVIVLPRVVGSSPPHPQVAR